MYDNIIDGVYASKILKDNIKREISKRNIKPTLAVIQIGDNSASNIYIRNKQKACSYVGMDFKYIKFDKNISSDIVVDEIKKLNLDNSINGILVQLPIPKNFDEGKIINCISPVKDVDGLTYQNVGNLVLGNDGLVPCTPSAVMQLLKMYNVNLEGKMVCLIGRSNLVGRPLIQLLLRKNATVSIIHSKSKNIKDYTKRADVLIVAAGHPNLITSDMVKKNSIVIDVGINKENNVLCGDVDFEKVKKKAFLITPVPGGVGPMTVACLLKNTLKAYNIQNK